MTRISHLAFRLVEGREILITNVIVIIIVVIVPAIILTKIDTSPMPRLVQRWEIVLFPEAPVK